MRHVVLTVPPVALVSLTAAIKCTVLAISIQRLQQAATVAMTWHTSVVKETVNSAPDRSSRSGPLLWVARLLRAHRSCPGVGQHLRGERSPFGHPARRCLMRNLDILPNHEASEPRKNGSVPVSVDNHAFGVGVDPSISPTSPN